MAIQPHNSIKVANIDLKDSARTYLTQDVSVGGTSLSIASITGFPDTLASDFYVLVGDYGDEKSEIVLVDASATSGKVFTASALISSHEASDPVTFISHNQIKFFGMTSSTGTPTLLDTLDIDTTAQFTEYTYTGTTFSFFKTAYYHEDGDYESGFSEVINSSSFTRRSSERIVRSGARKALTTIDESPNSRLTWDIALETLQDGLDEVGARKKRWPFWNTITTGTTTTNNQNYIDKPTDLTQLVRIKVNGYQLDWFTKNDYNRYTEGTASTGQPSHFVERDQKYYLYPTPNGEYDVEYEYYKVPDVIGNLSTEIDIPLVPVLIYYCGSQFAYIRGNKTKGDALYEMYTRLLEEQVEEYGGPEQDGVAEYVERTSIFDDELFVGVTI